MKFKFTIITAVAMLLFSYAINVNAQTRNRNRVPVGRASQTASTQTAVTKDGRTVSLKSDGTWEYANEQPNSNVAATTPIKQSGVLSLEVGLVFKSGDVKPVARTTFYLLVDDLAKILKEAGIKTANHDGTPKESPDEDLVEVFALATKYKSLPAYQSFYPAALAALKPHVVQSVTTDFSGKAIFESLPTGTYYLMGVTQTPKGYAIWNLRVDIKSGQSSIVLDQNNAVIAL